MEATAFFTIAIASSLLAPSAASAMLPIANAAASAGRYSQVRVFIAMSPKEMRQPSDCSAEAAKGCHKRANCWLMRSQRWFPNTERWQNFRREERFGGGQ